MSSVLMDIIDLRKDYKMGKVTVSALRGVSLQVFKQEFLAVTGPSGSGKTTLLQMMGGLDRPSSGRVVVNGTDITRLNEAELTDFRRRHLGFVFQFFNLFPVLSALENVELPMAVNGMSKEARRERAEHLLTVLGLEDRMHHRPDELSGGEQQRVAIARALANRPLIVLADEPTGNLDWETGEQVVTIMREAVRQEEGTLVLVTHNVELARSADRRIELKSGVIQRCN